VAWKQKKWKTNLSCGQEKEDNRSDNVLLVKAMKQHKNKTSAIEIKKSLLASSGGIGVIKNRKRNLLKVALCCHALFPLLERHQWV